MAVKDELAAVAADAMQRHQVPGVAIGIYAGGAWLRIGGRLAARSAQPGPY